MLCAKHLSQFARDAKEHPRARPAGRPCKHNPDKRHSQPEAQVFYAYTTAG